jgi:hypothetical protein
MSKLTFTNIDILKYHISVVLSIVVDNFKIEDTIHNVIAAKAEFKRFLGKVRKRQCHYPKYLQTFKVDKGLHISAKGGSAYG